MWIDSHCHLDLIDTSTTSESASNILAGLNQLQCQAIMIPSTCGSPSMSAQQLYHAAIRHPEQSPEIYTSFGYHPWELNRYLPAGCNDVHDCYTFLQKKLSELDGDSITAIGETGLDKVKVQSNTEYHLQQMSFQAHCQLSAELQLPLLIHSVKAHNDTIRILKSFKQTLTGVIHGFTGSMEQANAFIELGFFIGVGGSITYPRAKKTRSAIAQVPLQSLLLETDAPSMPLHNQQGISNMPSNITLIADELSSLKNNHKDTVLEQCNNNFYRMLKCLPAH